MLNLKRVCRWTEKNLRNSNTICRITVVYLPTLRSTTKVMQNQHAMRIGVAHTSMVAFESMNRRLYLYLDMALVFMQNEDSKKLWKVLIHLTE